MDLSEEDQSIRALAVFARAASHRSRRLVWG